MGTRRMHVQTLADEISTQLTRIVRGDVDHIGYLSKSDQEGCKLALQVLDGRLYDLSMSQLKSISKSLHHNDFPKLVACATLSYSIFLAVQCKKFTAKVDAIPDSTPDGAYFAIVEDLCYQTLIAHGFSEKSAGRHSHDARSVYFHGIRNSQTEGV